MFCSRSTTCPLTSPFSFFFYSYGDHRDLHSFPTRRSSDLPAARRSRSAASIAGKGPDPPSLQWMLQDRKSTRLNSSHGSISYAVFCLKKKKKKTELRS